MAAAITVTLNPAIDQTVHLARLRPGEVNRAERARDDAGGKGINVAACLADWGVTTVAAGVLGAGNTGTFEQLFRERRIVDHCLRVAGHTRTNIKLVAADSGDTTDINLPGLALSQEHLQEVADRLAPLLRRGQPVVLSGSLPAGAGDDAWARLLAQAQQAGARVVLDTSGAPLAATLAGPALPDVLKPNRHELESWAGHALPDRDAVLKVARALLARGVGRVVVSLGTDGALFVDAQQALLARPPRLALGSSVGAGDAMVAGLAAAMLDDEASLAATARLATAFAMSRLESGDARRLDPVQVRAWAGDVVIEPLA